MEFHRIGLGRLITAAFFGDDVQDHRFVLVLQEIEGFDKQFEIVTVDWPVVVDPELLEKHVGEK